MPEEICSVSGCSNPAERSLSVSRLPAGIELKSAVKRAKLCKEHYKLYKKMTKEERRLERSRYRV